MIDVKLMTRPKGGGGTSSSRAAGYGGGSSGEVAHAAKADKAVFAEQAEYAVRAQGAEYASYADKAGDLSEDSPVRKQFLSRLLDDIAEGRITFLQGLQIGKSFVTGSTGGMIGVDSSTGQTFVEIDRLYVRLKAIFEELEIHKNTFVGGKQTISPGGGITCVRVADTVTDADGNEQPVTATYTYTGADGAEHTATHECWRCWFNAEQDGERVENKFVAGDLCQCKVFNAREGVYNKISNKYYWRLVAGVGEDYIDISKTDCDTGSDAPEAGDTIVQIGNRADRDRQSAAVLSAVDTFSPSIVLYEGIDSYSYEGCDMVSMGVDKTTGRAFMNVYGDQYVGDRDGGAYMRYDAAEKTLTIKGRLEVTSTIGDKSIDQYIKDNSASSVDMTVVNNLINAVRDDLQRQIDGAIETWFYEGVPTLANAPASGWDTDAARDAHIGDLYYDKATGKAYRFQKDGGTYLWYAITDTDIQSALEAASEAQETADGKMKVFASQPKDSDAYGVGDLWVNATYGTQYRNDILRCVTAKDAGVAFAIAHWTLASRYTDDSSLEEFKTEYAAQVQSFKTQIDGKTETYFYAYEPTAANAPASGWTTDDARQAHAGDLFYNTATGYVYRWTGTAWSRLKDKDIETAMDAASKAQDTADGKRRVFMQQPATPYDTGDLWVSGGADGSTLMVCATGRAAGSYTAADWRVADDASLAAFSQTVTESLEGIQDQIDGKAETWYQATDPAAEWTTDAVRAKHKGDLWYDRSTGCTYYYDGSAWQAQDIPQEVFDIIDGKASIYVTKPSSYRVSDLWILEAAYTLGGTAYSKGELVTATATSSAFNAAHWTKKVKYTDDTKADTALSRLKELEYVKAALKETTTIDGGLVLTSLIRLGYTDGTGTYVTKSGISGIYDSTQKGGGIAAWYGGGMIDGQVTGNETSADRAKSLFRMDGTGYLADGKLSWDASGNLFLGSGISLSGVSGSLDTNLASILNFISGLNSLLVPVDKSGNELTYQNAASAYALKAKVGFFSSGFVSTLGLNSSASGGGGGAELLTSWDNYNSSTAASLALGANLGYGLRSDLNTVKNDVDEIYFGEGLKYIETPGYGGASLVSLKGTYSGYLNDVLEDMGLDLSTLKTLTQNLTATRFNGNAASATQLATARTINGTSFNGTANITTASWGTARSIYIADATAAHTGAAVSVNGSANVTLRLPATITAALVGNATTATTLATARTIALTGDLTGSASFNGSADASIAATIGDNKVTLAKLASPVKYSVIRFDSIVETATLQASSVIGDYDVVYVKDKNLFVAYKNGLYYSSAGMEQYGSSPIGMGATPSLNKIYVCNNVPYIYNGSTLIPITTGSASVTVINNAPTLAWNTTSTIATVNGTAITVKLPSNPNTDTKNTAGSTNTSSKIYLIGATSQAANPVTYSHDTAYVGTDGCLYSGGAKVLTAHQSLSNYVTLSTAQTISGAKTFTGAVTLQNATFTTNHVLLNNNIGIYSKDTAGTARSLSMISTTNEFHFGYGSQVGGYNTFVDYGKNLYLRSPNGVALIADSSMNVTAAGYVSAASGFLTGSGSYKEGDIELYRTTPYIDFHYNKSTADYTNRIIEGLSGQLTVTGALRVGLSPTTSTNYKFYVSGTAYVSGGLTQSSDARLKDILGDAALSVEAVAAAPAVRFRWKDSGEMAVGSTAQYWRTLLPEAVGEDGGRLSLDYGVTALLAAVSTARRVVEHEERIRRLERAVLSK